MKIKITTAYYLLPLLLLSLMAGAVEDVDTREIVGSGIFSTTINDIRNYTIDTNTAIFLDDSPIDQQLFEIVGSGYKSRFRLLDDVDANSTTGTLEVITLITDIKGIVTSIDPLTIMDQAVLVTADTLLVNLTDVAELLVGDSVEISGYINQDSSLQVSRLEKKDALNIWKVRGYVTLITDTTSFNLGNLNVLSNAIVANCPGNTITVGDFVEIKANVDGTYAAGQPLSTLTTLECQTPDVDTTPEGVVPSVIEGFVSEILSPPLPLAFMLNDTRVETNAQTLFDNGEAEHIDLGVNVEVQGLLDTNTGIMTASEIRFLQHRVKIKAPISTTDIVIGESVTILGNVFLSTPQTRDDDAIIANGIASDGQIEIRGFVDSDGQGYILRIRDRGSVDFSDVSLRGDVLALNNPIINVLNTNIDASNSVITGENGEVINVDDLFALLAVGSQVQIENGLYDVNTNTISGGEIEINETETEDSPNASNGQTREIVGSGLFTAGKGIATITAASDLIFSGNMD
ncbi:MAG TPA: hypothetical protein ENJ41_03345 [Oceanospirillales bacterium]|nr:hypothetical protein [Oceanospirillales bacterium]